PILPIAAPAPSPFKAPANPSIPQDLAVIAELVNTYQAVGSLPPLTISAAEKRKQVEASIRARMEALKNGKGKEKVVEPSTSDEGAQAVSGEEEAAAGSLSGGQAGSEQPMSLEDATALRSELDKFVGEEAEGGNPEFVFSDSPAPSPRKRPMTFETIDDDEEPTSSDPIVSAHEAPLPPVPQPPFARLPAGETLSLAGEVVSWMRERKVEAWWDAQEVKAESSRMAAEAAAALAVSTEKDLEAAVDAEMEEGEVEEPVAAGSSSAPEAVAPPKAVNDVPRFSSSGTIVIRAMQERPGQEGWLEEGSVVCHSDGRVLGFVSDTFGPLTAPFYSVRLPPPPFPLPSNSSLTPLTRLSYPTNPQYRSFVNMLAVQDPRFKGSDASNIHDEEVGEDEAEWSDDEMEAEAKKRRKNKRSESRVSMGMEERDNGRGGWAVGHGGTGWGGGVSHQLPVRPHFDYVPEDASDAASFYGGEEDEGDDGMISEAGSSASRRPAPMPYDLDEMGETGPRGGRGRGGGRGGRGGGGGGRGRGRGGNAGPSGANPARPAFGLPQRPQFEPQFADAPPIQMGFDSTGNIGLPLPHASLPAPHTSASPSQPGFYAAQQSAGPSTSQAGPFGIQHVDQYRPKQAQGLQYPQHPYHPAVGSAPDMGGGNGGGGGGPAINPRFAAQYQQMQLMSHLAAWQGQAQAQGQGEGGQGGQGGGQGGYGGGGYSE
ncbi:putative transporter, partial [Dioszegia hungarica]